MITQIMFLTISLNMLKLFYDANFLIIKKIAFPTKWQFLSSNNIYETTESLSLTI